MSAGAVALGLAATASRTPSSDGSPPAPANTALPGAANDAATPSFADMLDKASPNLAGNGHGLSTTSPETPSGHPRPDAAGDARYAAGSESAQTPGHTATSAKRATPAAGPPATERATPVERTEAAATTTAATTTAVAAGRTAGAAAAATGTDSPRAAGAPLADAPTAIHKPSSPLGTSSSPTPESGSGAGKVAALHGAQPVSTQTNEASADAGREATPAAGTAKVTTETETPDEAAVVPSAAATAPRSVPVKTPSQTRGASSPRDGAAPSSASPLSSTAAPSGATALGALATSPAGSPEADPRQAVTRSTHSSDNTSSASPVAANPAAASAAAPVSVSSRASQSSAGAEFHVTSIDDPSLSPSGFVGNNSGLSAAISQPKNLGDGVYQLHAALNPPALGHVDATVKVDGTNIEVVLVAHTPEGHQQLAANLDQLRDALSQGGSGDVQLTLSERGRQETPHQPGADPSTTDPAGETDLPLEHLLVTTPVVSARSSLHVIL